MRPSRPFDRSGAKPLPSLPALREDLRLHPGPNLAHGAPTWTLQDPSAHRFFRLGRLEIEILQRWNLGAASLIAENIARATPLHVDAEQVEKFLAFAREQDLLRADHASDCERLATKRRARRLGFGAWLLKNYLFLRIPLLAPDAWLRDSLPWVAWAFTPTFFRLLAIASLLGLYLASRQWDRFVHAFVFAFTAEGALAMALALSLSKCIHELGHAWAAKRHGCRVPSMGIAFIVFWPVLWTDVTEAWTLTERRARLAIDAAGMLAELLLAAVAALLWCALPDGSARTGAHLLAGGAWLMTLGVNLNPFMRFDGYYLLADWLDMPNLQDRAFALARWRLRALLLGVEAPPPETFTPDRARFLILYAWGVWLYRLILFFGIALLVYRFAFKALGLFLMAVEIGWFIVRPIYKELAAWRSLPKRSRARRNAIVFLCLAAPILAVPWHGRIYAPALLQSARANILYSPQPARIARIRAGNGQAVREGDIVIELEAPDLDYKIAQARRKREELLTRIAGQTADAGLAKRNPVDMQTLRATEADLAGLLATRGQLTLRAGFDAVLRDFPEWLAPGAWVTPKEPLGALIARASAVEAYIAEADLSRVRVGDEALFYAESGDFPPSRLRIAQLDCSAARALNALELASIHGGGVAARLDKQQRPIPEEALYRVLLVPDSSAPPPEQTVRGRVVAFGERRGLLQRIWRYGAALLVRESGW
jgi:putative peptide zinc metalloprotease protein